MRKPQTGVTYIALSANFGILSAKMTVLSAKIAILSAKIWVLSAKTALLSAKPSKPRANRLPHQKRAAQKAALQQIIIYPSCRSSSIRRKQLHRQVRLQCAVIDCT